MLPMKDFPLSEAIRLDLWPIDNLESNRCKEIIQECKKQLKQKGACELTQFVTEPALKALQDESRILESIGFWNPVSGNAYLEKIDPTLPADHPKRLIENTSVGVVAYDQFPKTSLLRKIFEWDPLMYFVGSVLELPEIYRYADPMGGLNLSIMKDKDYLRWHFDQTDFVTSLAIQSATTGGYFEYVPMIRNSSNENYDGVKKVLLGDSSQVEQVPTLPGSLILFKGRYSMHRVTPIEGAQSRYMALFAFDSKEGVVSTDHLRMMRYGRNQAYEVEGQ